MKKKVSIIDCGTGNILSIIRAFNYIDVDTQVVNSKKDIESADRLIFPGVGTFSNVMSYINKENLFSIFLNFFISEKPFLGICLGMQVLFDESEEFGKNKGFSLINGQIRKIKSVSNDKIKIPHTNWNSLLINNVSNSQLNKFLSNNLSMYFTHSYMALPINLKNVLAYTLYKDIKIPALVHKNNIYGCQFHPEKSGEDGLHFLRSFMKI